MLAIIIPYYKRTFFEATLRSLAAQTCKDFKVYIGNDASTEDPADLLQHFQGQFDFVYRCFETNLGGVSLTQQWERCIALSANEPWLMILGDDDLLGEKVVEAFYKNLEEIEKIGCNVVRFATQIIDGEGETISKVFGHPKLEKATDSFWRKFKGETRSSLSEYIFSRVAYSKYGFKDYPLAWHSDDMAWLEFSFFENIFSINSKVIKIRESVISISGRKDNSILKTTASHFFYFYLSDNYIDKFSKCQKIGLINKVEKYFFQNKSSFLFVKLLKWHIINNSVINLIKFIRRTYLN